ncbi:hypothetical protein DERF_013731 [Dermatophagoides farinae]|uniref:Uncharacterized protein n=1 Tax=Dermatophagoides farinae TaxID=6954 RepID=A0A922HQT7_DERFA|nr:hypothetical protein DERF_013731 [Dermatophagoides farinae]
MNFKKRIINECLMTKCPTNGKELKILFNKIDNLCNIIDLPVKLVGLDETLLPPREKKCPKTNDELNILFNKIDDLCKIDLPPKLDGLTKILPSPPREKKCPKTKDELNVLFNKIDDLCKIDLPPKLDGLDSITIIERKNYPKTKEELDVLFNEIENFLRIDIPFKLGDLHEENERLDSNEQIDNDQDSKPNNNISLIHLPSDFRIQKKRQKIYDNNNDKNQNQRFKMELIANRLLPIKDRKIVIATTKPKPMVKMKNKNVKITKKQQQRKMVPKPKSNNHILPPFQNLSNPKDDIQSRMRFFQEYLSTIKQQYSTDKNGKKQSNNDPVSDSGYSSSSPCSLSSLPSSPASSISSRDEICSTKSSSSSSSTKCSFSSSNSSLISKENPNGKTVYLKDQCEKFIGKQKTNKRRGSKSIDGQKSKRSNKSDIDNRIIEWSSKTFTDCPSTPKHLKSFENGTPPPPQSPSYFIDNNQSTILDLECLNDFIIDDYQFTAKQSSIIVDSSVEQTSSDFDDWLREKF